MTPKEKAGELVKKMYGNIFDGGQFDAAEDAWQRSKQCALIAVDEILKLRIAIAYWQEVKKEIELL